MAYLDPLAYLVGVEGLALLRGYAGHYDRAFVEARLAEVRRLLDEPALAGRGIEAGLIDTVAGYREWSKTYDDPGNSAFDVEEPFVEAMLDGLPAGDALDAACGTGRHTARLVARGHRVIGVDSSSEMLDRANVRAPEADLRLGGLRELPVASGSMDLVVCSLALTHVPDLGPVFAEFARVLRPGGTVITSDMHAVSVAMGSVPRIATEDGIALMPAYWHLTGDYVRAALAAGLDVRECVEPRNRVREPVGELPAQVDPGEPSDWPWTLLDLVPAARTAAFGGAPIMIIWRFGRP